MCRGGGAGGGVLSSNYEWWLYKGVLYDDYQPKTTTFDWSQGQLSYTGLTAFTQEKFPFSQIRKSITLQLKSMRVTWVDQSKG